MSKKRRVAVVTDTISPDFYFPLWHAYYGRNFGEDNLFVILNGTDHSDFAAFKLGGLWRSHVFNNNLRCGVMADICRALLNEYDYVIRVDTDEFLVPDIRKYNGLADYMDKLTRPYVTAIGCNVVCDPTDAPLTFSERILGEQRTLCLPYDALNKSAVTGIPIHWTPGFHFASVSPEFNDLYLFHMKLADIDMQVAIGAAVAAQADQAQFQEYHRSSRAKIEANLNSIRTFQTIDGWAGFDRSVYQASFMEGIRYVPEYGGVYHGRPFAVERVLLRIPKEFGNHL